VSTDLSEVFARLAAVMRPYAAKLDVKSDTDDSLYVDTRHMQKNGKPLFFGAVQRKAKYVSYHLMPVYVDPDLLKGISPALKKRMQGKSCFNFKDVDPTLFEELEALTKAGFESFRRQGYI
jgi:hypothetical protein